MHFIVAVRNLVCVSCFEAVVGVIVTLVTVLSDRFNAVTISCSVNIVFMQCTKVIGDPLKSRCKTDYYKSLFTLFLTLQKHFCY